ncbi:hypothetical protein EVAR_63383_1 [Eumeta japonica]|uniref:Uncharacterized protein n=1 Tax=Eumeta variegata TaxID=151549 RepID=A0A4C1YU52_EUMVA|nr:hypothetical protein EVAR_63383_1 [Eumeta japonica]
MPGRIYRAYVCDGRVGELRPRKSYPGQIGGILKTGQILSARNRRACVKRLVNVSEVRVCALRPVEYASCVQPASGCLALRALADMPMLAEYLLGREHFYPLHSLRVIEPVTYVTPRRETRRALSLKHLYCT